jgi:2-alkyl-3-oxoalkanoate reductase
MRVSLGGAEPVVGDVFDADGVRAAVVAAAPEAVVHQLASLRASPRASPER